MASRKARGSGLTLSGVGILGSEGSESWRDGGFENPGSIRQQREGPH